MTPSKKISISQGNTSRDYSHIWDLDNGNFLAFLADAPSHAEQRSGMYVKKFINENVESFKNTVYQLESDEIALFMADFITAISDDLLKIGKGNAYATMILTLVLNEYLYALAVGDAVLYVIGKTMVRISEITRLNGRSFLAGPIPQEPIRYKEYSYIGSQPKCFTQKDVWRLPTDGMKLIALASDGAETQFGSKGFVNLLTQGITLEEKEQLIKQSLSGAAIKDDVTVLMAEVNLKHPANIVKRFQKEISEIRENQETIETNLESNNREIKTTLDNHRKEIINTIELFSGHVAQKINKKEYEETIENFNKSFETFTKGMDGLIDQRIKKNLEEDSGEVTIEGLLKRINNMIDARTTGVKNDLDERTKNNKICHCR
jgi:serine/threonine protein phosphatase PrpC